MNGSTSCLAPVATSRPPSLVAGRPLSGCVRCDFGRSTFAQPASVVNAFTVDVEEHFQVQAFEHLAPRNHWHRYESRVADNTFRLLELLATYEVRATFFVLGWIARRHPSLVRAIQRAGHEIGSHGYWHSLVYQQTPAEFRSDLRQSKAVLEDLTSQPVRSYRAPSFSIMKRSWWALDILAEEGIGYDASIFPVYHDRYGIPDACRQPHVIETTRGPIWEFPASTLRVGRVNLPIAGGGYFRLYPAPLTLAGLSYLNRHGEPFVFYIHPWEIDPRQPRLRDAPLRSRFRHYVNLRSTQRKLARLLERFRFGSLIDAIDAWAADPLPALPPSSRTTHSH
jgi:polysaccharide deacetylase family protein (PEP-CTERM system associated)